MNYQLEMKGKKNTSTPQISSNKRQKATSSTSTKFPDDSSDESSDDLSFLTEYIWNRAVTVPGYFFVFNTDNDIHREMTLPGLTLPAGLIAGVNPSESAVNLKEW
jgi:hypothetical protein